MPRAKDIIDKLILRENYGVTRSVSPPKGRPNTGTKPAMTFSAINETGDDLVEGEVVEITSFDGVSYTIRKPSAVNLLNVAVCASRAPVGERVELTTDGTHTVSVSGTVALGATLGTQAGSTALAPISIGEAGYPAIGFVAMSASSGGSCQARFFSSSLPCRQPDRAFGTIAKIGVGGGSEDVTVADLYALRDWINSNSGYDVYHATLYANQTIDVDLLMPDNRTIIISGQSFSVTLEKDFEFQDVAYLQDMDFVFDTTSRVELGADLILSDNPVLFRGCTFSHTDDVAVEPRITGDLFCTCTFTFDLLGDGTNSTDILIRPDSNNTGYWMLDCTFTIEYLLDSTLDTQVLRPDFVIDGEDRTISNSTLDFTTSGAWAYGEYLLNYDVKCDFVGGTYDFDLTTSNTREDGLYPRNTTFYADVQHPAFENCECTLTQDITVESCLAWFAGTPDERFGSPVSVRLFPETNGIKGMELDDSITCTVTIPNSEVDPGGNAVGAGSAYVFVDELFRGTRGEIKDSTFTKNRTISVTGGNGTDGADGVDDDGEDGGFASSCTADCANAIYASIVNSEVVSNVTLDIVGGKGGDGGNGNGKPTFGTWWYTGGDGGRGTVYDGINGLPSYESNFLCPAMFNSSLTETRSLTVSGGNGGNGGNGGTNGRGGNGGQGYIGGNGGNGGDGSPNQNGGNGGAGGVGFTGGNGGNGGTGGTPDGNGGDGGDGGDGFFYNYQGTPNTAGSGGTGGSAGTGSGSDGDDGADGDPNGTEEWPQYEFDGEIYKYQVALSTNAGYIPDDIWPGSMDANGVIYIDPIGGDDTNDGQSWANAIETFSGGINGYLISDVFYRNFSSEPIGVLRPETTVTTYRTITGDGSTFTSNRAGLKISLDTCAGDFEGFDILTGCDGSYVDCIEMSACNGTTAENCVDMISCGTSENPFDGISYSQVITGCFSDRFDGCVDLAGCIGVGSGSGRVFEDCYMLDACDASLGETGFYNCSLLTNCDSYDNIGWGFYQSRIIDWTTCREYDNGNSCDCPPTTKYPINCPNKEECDA